MIITFRIIFEVCLFGLQLKYTHLEEDPSADPVSSPSQPSLLSPFMTPYARYSSAQSEFLHLVKATLFTSFELAYYVGFIPVKFIPGDLIIYFDTTSIMVFTGFLWITSLIVMGCHWLEIRATEMQFNAQCLGKWTRY
jgi:hypothetical protein